MNRFDPFLKSYLELYLKYLNYGIINEIVICDETGDDYQKIMDTFGDVPNLKVYKNDSVLGVFKNKLKVASLASFDYIALIDSDNFADETYFKTVREYISDNGHLFSSHLILAPSFAKSNFNYKSFEGNIVTKANLKDVYYSTGFTMLLNTGNYIIHKNIINNITYDDSIMFYITSGDVLYFNLLGFLQFEDFQFHIVKDLEYEHIVHDGSIYLNTHHNCDGFLNNVILPQYEKLAS
jgi:hypothetical protein